MHIGDLHAETEQPKTEHQIVIRQFCCSVWGRLPGYLFDPQRGKKREQRERGRQRLSELLALCASAGEADTQTGQSTDYSYNGPYGCYSLHFSKTKYFFKWLWAHWPGTHTYSLSLFYRMVWPVCVSWLRFCHRTFIQSVTMTGEYMSTGHYNSSLYPVIHTG